MLSLSETYYVNASDYPQAVVAGWAKANGMELIGNDFSLPTCRRVFELDVWQNNNLRLKMAPQVQNSGRRILANGERTIGYWTSGEIVGQSVIIIYPEMNRNGGRMHDGENI